MSIEKWDVYDVHRNRTGKIVDRGTPHGPGEFHLVVTLCLFDERGRMLIQRRSDEKELWPGLWDVTVGGSAVAGENSQEAMQRETFEELGIALDFSRLRPAFTANYRNGFDDVYVLRHPVALATLAIPNREVVAATWATRSEVAELIRAGQFLNYRASFIDFAWDFIDRTDVFA
ncbi:NUDIX domain-containing protein [Corynebacterium breve]|uniref:NUDIX domain-containing protein n=1 Tax=Corynebacterium breve TaxID=3049799 RepID=A0ABY8VF61_9CORY|nr:NUDIX domain-containing protein [Corynebacterium breve]WIM66903.1 NUDIX domain-containing protein [Corynebacterium breve]